MQGLLLTEQRYTAQIAEIIRRDPSLTSRLLRLVNSVYYGLSTPVNSIEEAVFYLGVRQIRQLAMVTPVIEDFQRLTRQCDFPWREFWQHCIGTAILTREVTSSVQAPSDDSDYVAGLVHDVGKIVMAWTFPDHFAEIHRQAKDRPPRTGGNRGRNSRHRPRRTRRALSGTPSPAGNDGRRRAVPSPAGTSAAFPPVIASVQIADLLLRSENIGCSGNYVPVTREQCFRRVRLEGAAAEPS